MSQSNFAEHVGADVCAQAGEFAEYRIVQAAGSVQQDRFVDGGGACTRSDYRIGGKPCPRRDLLLLCIKALSYK